MFRNGRRGLQGLGAHRRQRPNAGGKFRGVPWDVVGPGARCAEVRGELPPIEVTVCSSTVCSLLGVAAPCAHHQAPLTALVLAPRSALHLAAQKFASVGPAEAPAWQRCLGLSRRVHIHLSHEVVGGGSVVWCWLWRAQCCHCGCLCQVGECLGGTNCVFHIAEALHESVLERESAQNPSGAKSPDLGCVRCQGRVGALSVPFSLLEPSYSRGMWGLREPPFRGWKLMLHPFVSWDFCTVPVSFP